jgi:hypothetical protein
VLTLPDAAPGLRHAAQERTRAAAVGHFASFAPKRLQLLREELAKRTISAGRSLLDSLNS